VACPRGSRHVKFVGRSAEGAALERAARNALSGPGEIVGVVGEPGVGKSRLVHEFVKVLEKEDWHLVEAEAAPTSLATPYSTIKAIILSLLGNTQSTSVTGSSDFRSNIPVDFPRRWHSAIDAVLGQPIDDAEWEELDPTLRRNAIIEGCRTLIERHATRRRTVILLEDLHWIDAASDAVFEAVVSIAQRDGILILFTSRVEATPTWLVGKTITLLSLKPLDHDGSRALLNTLLGHSPDLSELKARVQQHTGGIPLFIEEVVRRLVETGVVAGKQARFTLGKPINELGIPPTIQGVIAARIDRLPRREKALLQVISGIGVRADAPLILAVAGISKEGLREGLRFLGTAGLLLESTSIPIPAYEFPHDLVREVAYESILQQDRTRLHERILSALEKTTEDRLTEVSESLSYHAVRGKLWSKAASYAHLAAQKCLARSALADATRYFEIAVDATDQLPPSVSRETQAIDLRLEARRAFSAYGKLQRWLELSAEAEQRAIAIADDTRSLAAAAVRAAAMNFYNTPAEAITAGEIAVQRAEHLGAIEWLGYSEYGLGQAYQTAGYFRHAEQYLGRALDRLSRPEARVPFGSAAGLSLLCCMMKSIAHASMGEADQAQVFQRRAVELATVSRQPSDIIAANYGRGFYQLRWGDPEEACTALEEALKLAQRYKVRYFVPIVGCQLAKCHLLKGNTLKAHEILSTSKIEAETLGYTFGVLRSSIYLVLVLQKLGDTSGALTLARAARLAAEQQGFEGLKAEALFAEALARARNHGIDGSEPKECLASVVAIATKTEARPQLAAAKALLSEILTREGDLPSSQRELAEANEIFLSMRLARPSDPIQYM
jgi:tetratricopeptide (TPR) repeat protein